MENMHVSLGLENLVLQDYICTCENICAIWRAWISSAMGVQQITTIPCHAKKSYGTPKQTVQNMSWDFCMWRHQYSYHTYITQSCRLIQHNSKSLLWQQTKRSHSISINDVLVKKHLFIFGLISPNNICFPTTWNTVLQGPPLSGFISGKVTARIQCLHRK